MLPAASRTTAVSVWVPFETDVVHGIDTGPLAEVVSLPTVTGDVAEGHDGVSQAAAQPT